MYRSVHGGDIYTAQAGSKTALIDYSANISPLGLPLGVREALKNAWRDCVHYPDPHCSQLRLALGKRYGLPTEMFICGNGAADLLFRFFAAIKPKRTLLVAPCFADYEKAAAAVTSKLTYYDLRPELDFVLDRGFLKVLTKSLDVVVLGNPNNPTGHLIEPGLLQSIVTKCANLQIHLLIDECFLDFLPEEEQLTLLPLLKAMKHLFILKAFTKLYAMPGVRLGFGISSDPELLEKMSACAQDWSVSVPAQLSGVAALREKDYIIQVQRLVAEERSYLKTQLKLLGFQVLGGCANYVFCKSLRPLAWAQVLQEQGFLIRDCSNYRNLTPGYYRFAVKKREDNRKLIKVMKNFLKQALLEGTRES